MKDLRAMDREEMLAAVEKLGEKKFRAEQVFRWVHHEAARSIDDFSNISKKLRNRLAENFVIESCDIIRCAVSSDGTKKYLFRLSDGQLVEGVLMEHERERSSNRFTFCVSTQAGCPMACTFCATGQAGFFRDLTAGEILSQIYETLNYERKERNDPEFRIGNVVYMGMGEPFLNIGNVIKSLEILHDEKGQGIGWRRMTVSTCGIIPGIVRFADWGQEVVLAVSLHNADDSARSRIMPVNISYPLADLKEACMYYQEKTGRRISFEYALIKGENDGDSNADKLVGFLQGIKSHVNIIPVNRLDDGSFKAPHRESIRRFVSILEKRGLDVSVRQEKGADIAGACGQLKASEEKYLEEA